MPYLLQTNHLTKNIGTKTLVSDVNLHVTKGEIYGFLGPNGAGKSTILKLITNLWKPSSGTIELFGQTMTKASYPVLKRMGNIIEFPTFYEDLTGADNLILHSEYMGYYDQNSVEQALDLLSLASAANQPVRSYSLGMKQRLGIARAILTKPELLILDEPVNGLDPAGIKQIRELLRMLCKDYGITIVISSHILSEIEQAADTIGIIHHGTLRKELSLDEITKSNLAYIEITAKNPKHAAYILSDQCHLMNFKLADDKTIRVYDTHTDSQALSKALALHDEAPISITNHTESLEDYFLNITREESSHVKTH